MTRGDVPGTTILGRPLKPLAVGFIIASAVLAVDIATRASHGGNGLLTLPTFWGSVAATAAAGGMVVAWIARSQRTYEAALLLMLGAWMTRGTEILLLGGGANAVLPFSFAIMAAGAYWLEQVNPYGQQSLVN